MNNVLVSYFSASGVTKQVAENISSSLGADLYEIEPTIKYTEEDLDWTNNQSRSSVEMSDRSFRPSMIKKDLDLSKYDNIILGFPVWWDVAPTIVNTFIESNDLNGKNIYIFVTSGSSSCEGSFNDLKNTYPNLNFIKAKRFTNLDDDYTSWLG